MEAIYEHNRISRRKQGQFPALEQAVRALGAWIGESGNSLVYGGSKSGLMGVLAESTLHAGGRVTGVEPQFFIDAELQYDAIDELIVTEIRRSAARK